MQFTSQLPYLYIFLISSSMAISIIGPTGLNQHCSWLCSLFNTVFLLSLALRNTISHSFISLLRIQHPPAQLFFCLWSVSVSPHLKHSFSGCALQCSESSYERFLESSAILLTEMKPSVFPQTCYWVGQNEVSLTWLLCVNLETYSDHVVISNRLAKSMIL